MFGPEHEDLRASLRRFVAERLRPHAAAWEDAGHFPDSVFTELAAHGFLGLKYPEALGGQGGDHLAGAFDQARAVSEESGITGAVPDLAGTAASV